MGISGFLNLQTSQTTLTKIIRFALAVSRENFSQLSNKSQPRIKHHFITPLCFLGGQVRVNISYSIPVITVLPVTYPEMEPSSQSQFDL
jgi:hypothetical protein